MTHFFDFPLFFSNLSFICFKLNIFSEKRFFISSLVPSFSLQVLCLNTNATLTVTDYYELCSCWVAISIPNQGVESARGSEKRREKIEKKSEKNPKKNQKNRASFITTAARSNIQ